MIYLTPESSYDETKEVMSNIRKIVYGTLNRYDINRSEFDTDSLISAGMVGYVQAIKKFPCYSDHFKRYAYIRIKGAVLDEVRAVFGERRDRKTNKQTSNDNVVFVNFNEEHNVSESLNNYTGYYETVYDLYSLLIKHDVKIRDYKILLMAMYGADSGVISKKFNLKPSTVNIILHTVRKKLKELF